MKIETSYPIAKRNIQLKAIFTNAEYEVKLLGDINQPKIIIDDKFAVSGYVHNRLYHFTTSAFGGTVCRTVNLNEPDLSKSELIQIFNTYQQRRFWRLHVANNKKIFFVKTENNTPMFAFTDSRYWFDEQKALTTKKYLKEDFGIDCILV